jgi:type IV pilus assembly protein PilA
MLESIKQRLGRDDEQGFTLIELMVVVLIIAILLAIAIPTFLGAKGQANARAAQSSLRNALTAEQTYFAQNQQFGTTSTTPSIVTIEPNLNWVASVASGASSNNIAVIGLDPATSGGTDYQQVGLQSFGKDGNCYTVLQINDPAVTGILTGYSVQKGTCPTVTAVAAGASGITSGSFSKGVGSPTTTSGTSFYQSW